MALCVGKIEQSKENCRSNRNRMKFMHNSVYEARLSRTRR